MSEDRVFEAITNLSSAVGKIDGKMDGVTTAVEGLTAANAAQDEHMSAQDTRMNTMENKMSWYDGALKVVAWIVGILAVGMGSLLAMVLKKIPF